MKLSKRQLRELLHSDERFGKLSIDASFLLNSFVGKDLDIDPQKENFNMCKAIDDMIATATSDANHKISVLSSENSALKATNESLLSENEMLKLELKRLKSKKTN